MGGGAYAADIALASDNNIAETTLSLTSGDRLILPDSTSANKAYYVLPKLSVNGDMTIVLPTEKTYNSITLKGGIETSENAKVKLQGVGTVLLSLNVSEPIRLKGSCEVTFKADKSLTIVPFENDFSSTIPEGEVAEIDTSFVATNWQSKVALWFDASKASSLGAYPSEESPATYTNGFPYIRSWIDCRANDFSGKYLYNGRSYVKDVTPPQIDSRQDVTYSFVVTNGLNGLNYISMGGFAGAADKRRLLMVSGEPSGQVDPTTSNETAYAILVFGSQQGGGRAILGSDNDVLKRAATTINSSFATSNFGMYVNGVATTADVAKPNGGWQVLSVDFNGLQNINALGRHTANAASGGQNYAEVLLFSEKPTDFERIACEKYLAKKWGLTADYVSLESGYPHINLDGRGSVAVTTDVDLTGGFQGTLIIPENRKVIVNHVSPPGEEVVPAENRIIWFDPDFPDATALTSSFAGDSRVNRLFPRTAEGLDLIEGKTHAMVGMVGSVASDDNRCPWTNNVARGYGPNRTWLEFSNVVLGDVKGNTMRFQDSVKSSQTEFDSIGDVVEAFMVLDTSKGGGTPIGKDANMTNTRRANDGKDASSSIWPKSNVSPFNNVVTRLDNEVIGTKDGFNARPEVLSFTFNEAWNPSFFGSYKDSSGAEFKTTGNAEVIGESIFFSAPLDDITRDKVSAYLAYKWFGSVLPGYSELSQMTVSGAGDVEVRGGVKAPKFANNYIGAINMTSSELSFTLNSRETTPVAGALVLPSDVTMPRECTINVQCTETRVPQAGVYPLITAKSLVLPECLTLNFTPKNPRVRARLAKSETGISLVVNTGGFMVIVR